VRAGKANNGSKFDRQVNAVTNEELTIVALCQGPTDDENFGQDIRHQTGQCR